MKFCSSDNHCTTRLRQLYNTTTLHHAVLYHGSTATLHHGLWCYRVSDACQLANWNILSLETTSLEMQSKWIYIIPKNSDIDFNVPCTQGGKLFWSLLEPGSSKWMTLCTNSFCNSRFHFKNRWFSPTCHCNPLPLFIWSIK